MQPTELNPAVEEILDYLSSIFTLTEKCRAYIRKVIKHKTVRKGETLLKIGEVNRYLYFIKKGALKCYYYHNGKPLCDWFFLEGETVVSIGSFYTQKPSEDCIEAVGEAEVYYITREDYTYLKRTFHEFAYIASELLEKYLQVFHVHARLIRKQSPLERFEQVMEKMPELLLRIDGKDLATWLNMDKATLSRQRSDWADQQAADRAAQNANQA